MLRIVELDGCSALADISLPGRTESVAAKIQTRPGVPESLKHGFTFVDSSRFLLSDDGEFLSVPELNGNIARRIELGCVNE